MAVARGDSVPGNPLVGVLVDQRLYLFHDAEARATFLTDLGRVLVAAERKWPAIAISLGQ